MITHTGERLHKCPYCGKGLQSKQSLQSHIRTHTGEKPYTCDVCGKAFADQAFFSKHKRLHMTDEEGNQVKECQSMITMTPIILRIMRIIIITR